MPVRFKQAIKEVALWADVVDAMDGKPYTLLTKAGIAQSKIVDARNKGYFGEGLTWRILKATNNRLKLTDYAKLQSSQQQQATSEQHAEINAG